MLVLWFILLKIYCINCGDIISLRQTRDIVNENEIQEGFGLRIILTGKEIEANTILMILKRKELKKYEDNEENFPPAMHFFKAKKEIDKSLIFSIIKRMPKGAHLSVHDLGGVSTEFLINNITREEWLWLCLERFQSKYKFAGTFFKKTRFLDGCNLVKDVRGRMPRIEETFTGLYSTVVDEPEKIYTSQKKIQRKMFTVYEIVRNTLNVKEIYEKYFYQLLQEHYDDNVQYIEVRSAITVTGLQNLEGTNLTYIDFISLLIEVNNEFKKTHPDWSGFKLIYESLWVHKERYADWYLQKYLELKNLYPDILAGINFIHSDKPIQFTWKGYVSLGNAFMHQLERYRHDSFYFFEAGETKWFGESDQLMANPIILNATRIAHAYSLWKHPIFMEEILKKCIGIEILPIANQVGHLVKDLRNHPAQILLSENYPVVIGNNHPGFYGAKGVSYDYYLTFMGILNAEADLRALKQLAINTIQVSSMSKIQKKIELTKWKKKWEEFIEFIIINYQHVKMNYKDVPEVPETLSLTCP